MGIDIVDVESTLLKEVIEVLVFEMIISTVNNQMYCLRIGVLPSTFIESRIRFMEGAP